MGYLTAMTVLGSTRVAPFLSRRPAGRVVLALSALLLGVGASAATGAAGPGATAGTSPGALPALRISADHVVGISSGGYMATQLQVAHSSRFAGAGVYSAGSYYCAEGSLAVALADCLPDSTPSR